MSKQATILSSIHLEVNGYDSSYHIHRFESSYPQRSLLVKRKLHSYTFSVIATLKYRLTKQCFPINRNLKSSSLRSAINCTIYILIIYTSNNLIQLTLPWVDLGPYIEWTIVLEYFDMVTVFLVIHYWRGCCDTKKYYVAIKKKYYREFVRFINYVSLVGWPYNLKPSYRALYR